MYGNSVCGGPWHRLLQLTCIIMFPSFSLTSCCMKSSLDPVHTLRIVSCVNKHTHNFPWSKWEQLYVSGWCKPPPAVELLRQTRLRMWIFSLHQFSQNAWAVRSPQPCLAPNRKKNKHGWLGKHAGIRNTHVVLLVNWFMVLFCHNILYVI